MSVEITPDGTIRLEGHCPSEDGETLLGWLSEKPGAAIDWRACEAAHTAVIQVVLAAGRENIGPPKGEFLKKLLALALP